MSYSWLTEIADRTVLYRADGNLAVEIDRTEVEAGIYQETAAGKTQLPILDRLWRAQCRLERSSGRPPWAYDFELDREEEAAIARDFRNSRCPEF